MTDPRSGGRRRFLAGLAATAGVALAGCNSLPRPWTDDAESVTFTPAEAGEALSASAPTAQWPVPVVPRERALETERERIDVLLADVPDSVDAETVPNGVVREAIADARETARESSVDAADASAADRYHALRELRTGRDAARQAATTLAAIGDETMFEALTEERTDRRSAVRDERDAHQFRGADTADGRLRAALFAFQRESDLERAATRLRSQRRRVDADSNVVDLGEAAGALEFAAATANVWTHLDERYEASVEEPVDLEGTFADALERSIERADRVEFPDRDGDTWSEEVEAADFEDQRVDHLLWRAERSVTDARDWMRDALNAGELGTGLVHAVRFERSVRAFETVRERLEDGSIATLETAADVRAERRATIDAATTAAESITGPSPGAYVLAETVQSLRSTDEAVRRAADTDPDVVVSLASEYGDYARDRAALEALPDAVEAVHGRLIDA